MHLKLKILIIGLAFSGFALNGISSSTEAIDDRPATLKIFPNPVVDGTLSINSDIQIEKIEILSIVGQLVYTQELEPSNSVRLYLDQVKSGIYLIKVSFIDNTSDTKRIWVK
jgi:hypothetical protein